MTEKTQHKEEGQEVREEVTVRPGSFPDSPLTVAALSLDIAPGEVEVNLHNASEMLKVLPEGTDIAVLPELFTTSFMRDTDRMLTLSESDNGNTMNCVSRWARHYNMMIAGSFLAHEIMPDGERRYYNRGFIALPDGQRFFYDKHHLFCMSAEAEIITRGDRPRPIVAFRGWNVSMNICYELRFPVWSRNVSAQTDIVLIPANWPTARGYAWRHLLIARAIENQCVVVGCDCSGTDDYGEYDNMSLIVDEIGRQIAPAPAEAPQGCPPATNYGKVIPTATGDILVATFSLEAIRKLRKWLPVHRDADEFNIVGRQKNSKG